MFGRVLAALVLLLAPRFAPAQEVFGTLRREDTGMPSQGTIVVAERLSDGATIARAVTGARGTWRLRVSTDRLVIRALRIGFEPHVLDTLQLAEGTQRELNVTLPGTSVVLPTVRSAADSRCRVRPDSASLVAKIFHEARTALTASLLITPDGPVRSRVRITDELWPADESKLIEVQHREYYAASLRPFRTASVDSLLEFGFVTRHRESFALVRPASDVAVDYRVPSVDLIVDDRFLADYCLYLADERADRPDLIGVGFRPARNKRITQIEGTLWLDRSTSALQRMEFGYAGLDGSERRIKPGGWLEFTRLETGLWFVNRWALRVPAIGSWIESRGATTLRIILRDVPLVRVSGEVLDIAVDARTVFTAGATDFLEAGALVTMPSPVDSTQPACVEMSGTAFAFGTVRSTSGAALPAAELRFFWRAASGTPDQWLHADAQISATGQYRVCGLPHDVLLTVQVRADGHEPASIALRVSSPRPSARVDLVLTPLPSTSPNP